MVLWQHSRHRCDVAEVELVLWWLESCEVTGETIVPTVAATEVREGAELPKLEVQFDKDSCLSSAGLAVSLAMVISSS